MDVRSMNQAEREDSANEVRLLASIQHPNVISYNEAFLDGNRLCIIMEYAPDGDLAKVIKKYSLAKSRMPEDLIWKIWIQIARGLANLHNMKILHRDIKPGNIMVMQNDVCKIGDLGIAKLLRHTMAKTQIGTPHYMPPEIWRNKAYSFTSDSWAMGCILYEMATNNVPFEARSMNELKSKVLKGIQDLIQMVQRCMDQNPDRRPTLQEIVASSAVMARQHLVPAADMVPRSVPPSSHGGGMLDTIKVPRNFQLIKGKLPAAQYASDQPFGVIHEHEGMGRLPSIAGAQKNAHDAASEEQQARMAYQAEQQARMQNQQAPVPKPLQPNRPRPQIAKPLMIKAPDSAQYPPNYNKQAPSPSAYEALHLAQQQAQYKQNRYSPKPQTQQSESHAAYGAFYYSPKAAANHANKHPPVWADMYGQYGQKQPPAQQQQQQRPAYQGYYTPSQAGGQANKPPAPGRGPPAKLPSIASQQQQAAMDRLAAPRPPAWNMGYQPPKSKAGSATPSQAPSQAPSNYPAQYPAQYHAPHPRW
eukprot:gene8396-18290_t